MKILLVPLAFVSLCSNTSLAQSCGSKDGVNIPCWPIYLEGGEEEESLPFFPYAKRPNGCSIPGSRPGTQDSFRDRLGQNVSFSDACNAHDKCYYTLGTQPAHCNNVFAADLKKACEKPYKRALPRMWNIWGGGGNSGVSSPDCSARATVILTAVTSVENAYHSEAQGRQRDYLARVDEHVIAVKPFGTFEIVIPPFVIPPINIVIW